MTLLSYLMVNYDDFALLIIFLYRGKDALGEEVIKAYTPTTLDSDVGYFELVIKVHKLCSLPLLNCILSKILYCLFYLYITLSASCYIDVSTRKDVPSFSGDA